MNYGAVIVAAGLSSRMGDFKPLLQIGSRSVVQHVISAFQRAGIEQIVVVTGHNAAAVEAHLADSGVAFLHNEHYRSTQMFDSAKIGLSHMKDRCDRVFFTPVDIPLFSARTVTRLMESGAILATPFCNGHQGHPLMLSAKLIDPILCDSGEGGLKGTISRLGLPMTHVEVNDPGVLRDADTPEEFQALLAYYRQTNQILYPTDAEIGQLLDRADTPEPIRAHCAAVAEQAARLAVQTPCTVDTDLLRAACLLHDIARVSGKNHAAAGAELLDRAGFPVLARIVGQHHDLAPDASVEAQLLYLADKLVQGTQVVSPAERFSASWGKCATPEALAVWEKRYRDTLVIAEHLGLTAIFTQNGGTL